MVQYYSDLAAKYPIYSIEDGLDENDIEGWIELTAEIGNKVKLLKGMVLSNEPGYYEKDKFGIRIENLIILNKSSKKNLKFENLTLVPIDKSLIIKELMSMDEIKWLNNYHKTVFFKLKKFMNYKEKSILKDQCSNI